MWIHSIFTVHSRQPCEAATGHRKNRARAARKKEERDEGGEKEKNHHDYYYDDDEWSKQFRLKWNSASIDWALCLSFVWRVHSVSLCSFSNLRYIVQTIDDKNGTRIFALGAWSACMLVDDGSAVARPIVDYVQQMNGNDLRARSLTSLNGKSHAANCRFRQNKLIRSYRKWNGRISLFSLGGCVCPFRCVEIEVVRSSFWIFIKRDNLFGHTYAHENQSVICQSIGFARWPLNLYAIQRFCLVSNWNENRFRFISSFGLMCFTVANRHKTTLSSRLTHHIPINICISVFVIIYWCECGIVKIVWIRNGH